MNRVRLKSSLYNKYYAPDSEEEEIRRYNIRKSLSDKDVERLMRKYSVVAHAAVAKAIKQMLSEITISAIEIVKLFYGLIDDPKRSSFKSIGGMANVKAGGIMRKMAENIDKHIGVGIHSAMVTSGTVAGLLGIKPIWVEHKKYAKMKIAGRTTQSRLLAYSEQVLKEIEAYVFAAKIAGETDVRRVAEMYVENIKDPLELKMISDAGNDPDVLNTGLYQKYHNGKFKAAYIGLSLVVEDVIMNAFHYRNKVNWSESKYVTKKYVKNMGDSLVCGRCESVIGVQFDVNEGVVPLHNRCRCYEVPIITRDSYTVDIA